MATQYGRGNRKPEAIHFHVEKTKIRATFNRETVCGRLTCSTVTNPKIVTCKNCLTFLAK